MRVQKGVTKGLKGHLLQVKRALIEGIFMLFKIAGCEFSLQ